MSFSARSKSRLDNIGGISDTLQSKNLRRIKAIEMETALSASRYEPPGSSATLISRALLVIPRLYLGIILFISDFGKLTRDSPFTEEMLGFLRGVTTRRAPAPYLHFVQEL